MYYDLTKEQYKNYETKFRKTYIGKNLFQSKIACEIISLFVAINIAIAYFFDSSMTLQSLNWLDIGYLIVLFASIIGYFISEVYYSNELKNYILSQKK